MRPGAFFLPGGAGILGLSLNPPSGAAPPMLRILALILLSSLIAPAFADQRADTQRQLEAARQDVAELKKMLEKLQQEKSGVQQQLKKTETEMGDLENQVKDLQHELKDSEQEIQRLDQEKKTPERAH